MRSLQREDFLSLRPGVDRFLNWLIAALLVFCLAVVSYGVIFQRERHSRREAPSIVQPVPGAADPALTIAKRENPDPLGEKEGYALLGAGLEIFASEFKNAILADDRAMVAVMVQYPLRVNTATGRRMIRNRSELLARYDTIFTPALRRACRDFDTHDIPVSFKGIMLGRGEVWIDCSPRVVDINIPDR